MEKRYLSARHSHAAHQAAKPLAPGEAAENRLLCKAAQNQLLVQSITDERFSQKSSPA
jgi:hypothetical protein